MDDFSLVFYAWWADYEEDGWIIIAEKDGRHYYQEGGHCVMDDRPDYQVVWQPEPVTQEDALQLMLEWEEHEDTDVTTVKEAMPGD